MTYIGGERMMSNMSPEIAQVYTPADTALQSETDWTIPSQKGKAFMTGFTDSAIILKITHKVTYDQNILRLIGMEIPVFSRTKLAMLSASGVEERTNLSFAGISNSFPVLSP